MSNNDYTLPGIAAITLAVLFPMYWISLILSGAFDSMSQFYYSTIEFTLSDLCFVVLGILSIYIYLSFKRLLNNQIGFAAVNIPLNLIIATCAVYFVGLSALEIMIDLFGGSLGLAIHKFVLNANSAIAVGSLIVFGVADILIGAMILKNVSDDSMGLKVLAIIMIIQGVLEISIIFSAALILVFPITMVAMSLVFLQKRGVLEVI